MPAFDPNGFPRASEHVADKLVVAGNSRVPLCAFRHPFMATATTASFRCSSPPPVKRAFPPMSATASTAGRGYTASTPRTLYRLVLEKGTAGARYHGVADEGVPFRDIAGVIGRRANFPVVSKTPEEAAEHFGWFAHFAAIDCPASSKRTRELLGFPCSPASSPTSTGQAISAADRPEFSRRKGRGALGRGRQGWFRRTRARRSGWSDTWTTPLLGMIHVDDQKHRRGYRHCAGEQDDGDRPIGRRQEFEGDEQQA